jgi:hypothetical protein
MRICDTKAHGEIVFEGGYCGACAAIDDLEKQITELKDKLDAAYEELHVERER